MNRPAKQLGGLWLAMALSARLCTAQAQEASATTLRLQVIDSVGIGVPEATLLLQVSRRHLLEARTDAAGTVMLREVPIGLHDLRVRRIGMAPVEGTVRVAAGENAYTVRVTASAIQLEGIRIVGGVPIPARLDDFERRRLQGLPNAVVSRESIDRLRPVQLSRLLRGMAGLRIGDSLGNTVAISTRGAKPTPLPGGRTSGFALVPCVLRVVLDGILLPPLSNLDAIVPREVHGVEVYFGPSRIPPELAGLRTDSWCGVIAIWTRSG